MHIIIKKKNLTYDDYKVKCVVGKRGIGAKKREGDLITPKGKYKILQIFYRADRVTNLKSKISQIKIKKNMGWCDDPRSKNYNKLIRLPFKFTSEKLYRKDNKYDLLIVLDYNLKNPIPFKGSAIFIHLTKNYKPTAGCIALSKSDMQILLKLANKKSKIILS